MTRCQSAILCAIRAHPAAPQRWLAEHTHYSQSGVSRALRGLCRVGLVAKGKKGKRTVYRAVGVDRPDWTPAWMK